MKKVILVLTFLIGASAVFSQVLVPYRSGKLWGLADTLGKIKLAPQYDEIEAPATNDYWQLTRRGYQFFVVKKGKYYGLLNRTQVIMEPKYHKLRLDSLFVEEDNSDPENNTMDGSRTMIYDLKGKLLIPDTVQQVEVIKNKMLGQNLLFSVMSGKKKAGVFWYNRKEQKILQWIIKDVYNVSVANNSERLTMYVQTAPKMPVVFYAVDFNASLKTYEAKLTSEPKGQPVGLYGGPRKLSGSDESANFLVRGVEFRITDGKIIQLRRDYRYHDRKPQKLDTIRFNMTYDTAWVSKYFLGSTADWHVTHSYGSNSNFKATDTAVEFQNFLLYKKKGKTGLIVEQAVIPPVYDDIHYFMAGIIEKPYFMVAQTINGQQKWGVIKSDGKVVLPVVYDQIIRGSGGGGSWLLKKDNLYGVADYRGRIIVPAIYDNIIPGDYFLNFTIIHKGKYGYIFPQPGNNHDDICKPVFSYKITGLSNYYNYEVYKLVDDKGKSLGFGDKKGFLYFKD